MKLSNEQYEAVHHSGNTYVTACPGSGKTRALTTRLSLGMSQLDSVSEKVLAVTFTNRAADEIKYRIQKDEHYDSKKIWAGTIHSFALEWIIRPYAGYLEPTNNGFVVVDEYESKKILAKLKKEKGMNFYEHVNTSFDRDGNVHNADSKAQEVERSYREILSEQKKIDFDQSLYFAYKLLKSRAEIGTTLGAIFRLICIDEIQDTQDLQYAILSSIHNASLYKPKLFIVGDIDQAIYENIGGVSRTLSELNVEFEQGNLCHFKFSDNYRSTQRIVDFFSHFRNTQGVISKSSYSHEMGKIVYSKQEVDKKDLAKEIAKIVKSEIDNGVKENEICIIAPQWSPIRSFSKKIVNLLPGVQFDAPSLSPFHGQQDNFWLTVAKLALTIPSGRLYATRIRSANEVISSLSDNFHSVKNVSAKQLLMIINSFKTDTTIGTDYLYECFKHLLYELDIDLAVDKDLAESHALFFEKAHYNLEENKDEYENHIDIFRGFFKESTGVVINSCHGIKGEEYETVIAFGLLNGFVPNWEDIINKPDHVANNSESKMLYVIASRAKKNLYLYSESGRQTRTRKPYQSSPLLVSYNYAYDQ